MPVKKKKTSSKRKTKKNPSFQLSAAQKKKLPLGLQKAIIKFHRGK